MGRKANPEKYKLNHLQPKSGSRDDLLQLLWDKGLVNNYIKKLEYVTIDNDTIEDIIQEVWLIICEIPPEKIEQLYATQGITGLTAFISGVIYRQIHSNSSSVYWKFKHGYKTFVHISDKAWEVFDETNIMIRTDEKISTTETDIEKTIRKIEGNNNDID